MTILQGFLLGLLQGVAEFLPISSSGHLALLEHFLGMENLPIMFSIFLHLATLLSVVIFFRIHIVELVGAFFRIVFHKPVLENYTGSTSLTKTDLCARSSVIAIIIITIVTGVIGVFVKKKLPGLSLRVVCIGFIVTALLLLLMALLEKKRGEHSFLEKSDVNISKKQSLVIGVAQGLASLPGISRSGSTIASCIFSGIPRVMAGELSFVASIPAIFGAFLLEIKDFENVSQSIKMLPLVVSFLTAFVSGLFALSIFMRIIKSGKLFYFAFYLIPVGILGILFL